MGNKKIERQFYEFIHEGLSNTLENYENGLKSDIRYKYAIDNNERIEFLLENKHPEIIELDLFNPLNVKGVLYKNGSYELIKKDIEELVEEYGVNLNDQKHGLFLNEMDVEKPFGLQSYVRLCFSLDYCLQLQIINALINEIKESNFKTSKGNLIFLNDENVNSEAFFKYLVEKWLIDEPNKLTALKHITHKLWYKNDYKEIPYKIRSSLTDFAIYWNDNYKDLFEFKNIKKHDLNNEDLTKGQHYFNKFNSYLDEF